MTKIKGKIAFIGLDIDGKHQKEWFKIFDLLDVIFTDKEKEEITQSWDYCTIHNFHFDFGKIAKGTTKRAFAVHVAGNNVAVTVPKEGKETE